MGAVGAYTGLLNLLHGEVGRVSWEAVDGSAVHLRHYKAQWREVEVQVWRDRVVFRVARTEPLKSGDSVVMTTSGMVVNGQARWEEVSARVDWLPTSLADKVREIWLEVHQQDVVKMWWKVRSS